MNRIKRFDTVHTAAAVMQMHNAQACGFYPWAHLAPSENGGGESFVKDVDK